MSIDLAQLRFGQAAITCLGMDTQPMVWGWFVGPFIVWEAGEYGFNVSHVPTGLAVQKGIPEQARALVLAARLIPLADWSFTDRIEMMRWPAERLGAILALRAWACHEGVDDPYGRVEVIPEPAPAGAPIH